MSFFEQLNQEVSNLDLANIVFIFLLFYIPFFFSRKAETYAFRIFYTFMGLYLIFTSDDPRIIYDFKLTIGLALFIPQISFFIFFIKSTLELTKLFFTNTYYFFLTVYYKTLRLIHWFKNIPTNLKIFFKSKSSSYKEENSNSNYYSNSSYEEDNNSSYSNDNSYNNYDKGYTKQEEKYSYDENNSYTEQEDYSNDNSYEKEYESSYNKTEEDFEDNSSSEDDEYARFYSSNDYVVLGVSPNDDITTIKKAHRSLLKEYHTDKIMMSEPEKFKLYTEICQNIISAYKRLEKIH